jgi:UPF0755 protein
MTDPQDPSDVPDPRGEIPALEGGGVWKMAFFGLVLLVVLAGGGAALAYKHFHDLASDFEATPFGDAKPKIVVIPKGMDTGSVGKLLEKEKVIADYEGWHWYLKWNELNPKIKAGEYQFEGALTPTQVIEKMVKGEVLLHHFTIAEGLRCDEIMPIIAASELKLDAEKLTKLCTDEKFATTVKVKGGRLEGYLFPDTYSFPLGVTENQVAKALVERARREYAGFAARRDPNVKLDETQVFTLASIVEKETSVAEERPRIACLFHNRLARHMKLQTDPTVLYGWFFTTGVFDKDRAKHNWIETRTQENPYNTYLIPGLPVGPIANPGAKALEAVLKPAKCDDLFFVASGNGGHCFAKNGEDHERNVQRYIEGKRGCAAD